MSGKTHNLFNRLAFEENGVGLKELNMLEADKKGRVCVSVKPTDKAMKNDNELTLQLFEAWLM